MYISPCNTSMRSFQYKILHNILFLIKNFTFLELKKAHYVLSVTYMMKRHGICFMSVIPPNDYGTFIMGQVNQTFS